MSPTIRIDEDVYEKLKEQAEPFVDTPNTVIRRLLGLSSPSDAVAEDPASDPSAEGRSARATPTPGARPRVEQTQGSTRKASKRKRVPAGSLLPEREYDLPLLTTLVELGESAPSREVMDAVGVKVKDRLTAIDKEKLASGGIRWENRLQFVRLRLIERGLMIKESGRGIWAISEAGKKFVADAKTGAAQEWGKR